jgi:hypothetical protein
MFCLWCSDKLAAKSLGRFSINGCRARGAQELAKAHGTSASCLVFISYLTLGLSKLFTITQGRMTLDGTSS